MDEFDDLFNDSIQGLMDLYDEGFDEFLDDFIDLDLDPLEKIVDSVSNKAVSNIYSFCKSNFSNFQNPYGVAGYQLGQVIYSSVRDAESLSTGRSFSKLVTPNYSLKKLDEDMLSFWTISDMLEKAFAGEQTIDYVKQSGARGITGVAKSATIEMAEADKKVKKHAELKTSAGACDFCLNIAKFVRDSQNIDELKSVKFHNACNCALVFVFD